MTLEQRYGAVVEYDGTDFYGFQLQAEARTVQGEIEKCLERITQRSIRVSAAGRTDAGVHATGQVIAFNVAWKHALADLQRAINANLPADIVCSELYQILSPDFHPRFSAISRTYQYHILNQPWPSAVQRRYVYHVDRPLNIDLMRQASQLLLGSHDFASFGKPPQGSNTVRQVTEAEWQLESDGYLIFRITANAFLYRMVRKIVATLVQVGLGIIPFASILEILKARDLNRSAPPAPACGLYLVKVIYPENLRWFLTKEIVSGENDNKC